MRSGRCVSVISLRHRPEKGMVMVTVGVRSAGSGPGKGDR